MKLSNLTAQTTFFCLLFAEIAFAQGLSPKPAKNDLKSDPFYSVAIVISPELLDPKDEETARIICNNLARKLHPDTGPLGLGLFLETQCNIGKKVIGNSLKQRNWLLEINRREALVEVKISGQPGAESNSQAVIALPSFQDKQSFVEAFIDSKFTWLLSLGLLDQMPVLSRLNSNLLDSSTKTLATSSDSFSSEFSETLKFELTPVTVSFDQKERLWSIAVYKKMIDKNLQGNTSLFVANALGRSTNLPSILTHLNLTARQIESQESQRRPQLKLNRETAAEFGENLIEKAPPLLWIHSKFAMNALTGHGRFSYFSEVQIGTDAYFLGNLFLNYSFNSTPYFVSFPDQQLQSEQSIPLMIREHSLGLGVFESFQVKRGIWLIPTFQSKILTQSVEQSQKNSEKVSFKSLNESNLFTAGISIGAAFELGDFFTKFTAGFDTLVPYYDQYKFCYLELDSRYLLFGQKNHSSESRTSTLEMSAGPLLRVHYTDLKRYFPARKKGSEETPSTQVSIIDIPLGLALYVSF